MALDAGHVEAHAHVVTHGERELRKLQSDYDRWRRNPEKVEKQVGLNARQLQQSISLLKQYNAEADHLERESRRGLNLKQRLKFDVDETGMKSVKDFITYIQRPENHRLRVRVQAEIERSGVANVSRALRDIERDANRVGGRFSDLFGHGSRAQRGIQSLQGALGKLSLSFGPFSGRLEYLSRALTVIGPIVYSLIGVFGGFVASLGSAAGAVGAFGAALIAEAIPAVGLLGAVMLRLTNITDALNAITQEHIAKHTSAISAAQQRTDSENALATAQQNVENAARGIIAAERALSAARRDATRALEDASRAESAARERVSDAERDVDAARQASRVQLREATRAEVDAAKEVTQAMRLVTSARLEALGALRDLNNEQRNAALDVDSASLGLETARGALGEAQRNVNALNAQGLGGTAQGVAASRGVQEAQLGVRRAENELTAARRRAAQGQSEQNRLIQEGVRAYQPYIDAVVQLHQAQDAERQAQNKTNAALRESGKDTEAVRDAVRSLRDANLELARAEEDNALAQKRGVEGSDQVRAAQEGLIGAHQAEQAAVQSVGSAREKATEDALKQSRKVSYLLGKLSADEKEFLHFIIDTQKFLKHDLKPVTDHVFDGLTDGGHDAIDLVKQLRGEFEQLGKRAGKQVRGFGGFLDRDSTVRDLKDVTDDAGKLLQPLRRLAQNVLGVILNIGRNAAKPLRGVVSDFNDLVHNWEVGTRKGGDVRDVIKEMTKSFRVWMKLFGAAGNLLIDFFGAGVEQGDNMVKSLTTLFDRWDKWAKSTEGQASIADFFKDAFEFAKKFGFLLGWLAQSLANAAGTLLDIINPILWLIDRVPILGKILETVFGIALIAKLTGVAGALKGIVGWLAKTRIGTMFVDTFMDAMSFLPGRLGTFFKTRLATRVADRAAEGAAESGGSFLGSFTGSIKKGWGKVTGLLKRLMIRVGLISGAAGGAAAAGGEAAAEGGGGFLAGMASKFRAWGSKLPGPLLSAARLFGRALGFAIALAAVLVITDWISEKLAQAFAGPQTESLEDRIRQDKAHSQVKATAAAQRKSDPQAYKEIQRLMGRAQGRDPRTDSGAARALLAAERVRKGSKSLSKDPSIFSGYSEADIKKIRESAKKAADAERKPAEKLTKDLEGIDNKRKKDHVDTVDDAGDKAARKSREWNDKARKQNKATWEGITDDQKKAAVRGVTEIAKALAKQDRDSDTKVKGTRKKISGSWGGIVFDTKKHATDMDKGVRASLNSQDEAVHQGMTYITQATNKSLKAFDVKPISLTVPKPKHLFAGGKIPGTGLMDTELIMAAPGETAIINRHQEVPIDEALHFAHAMGASPYSSLDDVFAAIQTPHYMAGGGRPERSRDLKNLPQPNFGGHPSGVSAGTAQFIALMQKLFGVSVYATTDHAPGTFHEQGKAVDLVGNYRGAGAYTKSSGLYRQMLEAIQNPTVSADSGQLVDPSFWGASVWGQHTTHLHGAVDGLMNLSNLGYGGNFTDLSGEDQIMPKDIARVRVKGTVGPLRDMAQAAVSDARRAANDWLSDQSGTSSGGPALHGDIQGGEAFVATAYGPPWVGIEGSGTTATGIDLTSGPRRYIVAADPTVLPYHTQIYIWPNPFGYRGTFAVEDTGGPEFHGGSKRIDIYDWRGRASQNQWGRQTVTVKKAGAGSSPRAGKRDRGHAKGGRVGAMLARFAKGGRGKNSYGSKRDDPPRKWAGIKWPTHSKSRPELRAHKQLEHLASGAVPPKPKLPKGIGLRMDDHERNWNAGGATLGSPQAKAYQKEITKAQSSIEGLEGLVGLRQRLADQSTETYYTIDKKTGKATPNWQDILQGEYEGLEVSWIRRKQLALSIAVRDRMHRLVMIARATVEKAKQAVGKAKKDKDKAAAKSALGRARTDLDTMKNQFDDFARTMPESDYNLREAKRAVREIRKGAFAEIDEINLEDIDTGPSIAQQAMAQLNMFMDARKSLLSEYGNNFYARGYPPGATDYLAQAAGLRYYGFDGSIGQGFGSAGGGYPHYDQGGRVPPIPNYTMRGAEKLEVHNHFGSGPGDALHWTRDQEFELNALGATSA